MVINNLLNKFIVDSKELLNRIQSEKLKIIDRSIPTCNHLIMLCFYLKKLKFNYLNILEYYNN